jgi:hypothetical protein
MVWIKQVDRAEMRRIQATIRGCSHCRSTI